MQLVEQALVLGVVGLVAGLGPNNPLGADRQRSRREAWPAVSSQRLERFEQLVSGSRRRIRRSGSVYRVTIGRSGRIVLQDESSLLVFGPTRVGKTRGVVVPAILGWSGPLIATSVKDDVFRWTSKERSRLGQVEVIGDPLNGDGIFWDPVLDLHSSEDARAFASLLLRVSRSYGSSTGDAKFWFHLAEPLVAAIVRLASLGGSSELIEQLLRFEIADELVDLLVQSGEDSLAESLASLAQGDHRQIASLQLTAVELLRPIVDAAKLLGSRPRRTISSFLGSDDSNEQPTLYVDAPLRLHRQLAPYFTALIESMVDRMLEKAVAHRRPTLIVLDEAANIAPIPSLGKLASVGSSYGVQLVSVFQDMAQLGAAYGVESGVIVNNHRSRLFLSGIADPETLRLMETIMGGTVAGAPSALGGWRMLPRGVGWLVEARSLPRKVRIDVGR
ncbi:MAG: type IV secretory system conjugative DNA transfer family protein [Acidimicrobiales bacterium]